MAEKWIQSDVDFLVNNYSKHGIKYCANQLDRTGMSIKRKAFKLNLGDSDKWWTEEEIEFLKSNYITKGVKFCAKHLGRSNDAIRRKAKNLGLRIRIKWTQDKVDFIEKYYPLKGGQYCADRLDCSLKTISAKASQLNLEVTPERKSQIAREKALKQEHGSKRINIKTFSSCTMPETAYVLGFLWADGYFIKKSYRIATDIIEADANELIDIFQEVADWYISHRVSPNRQPQISFIANDKATYNFLASYKYLPNRSESPCSIIKTIPDSLLHYWFRGFFDGDGCFYFNPNNHVRQLSFAGRYDQDWTFLKNLFNKFDVKYQIQRRQLKQNSKGSTFRCSSKDAIISFGSFIYGNDFDGIGLQRKYDIYKQIINSYKR